MAAPAPEDRIQVHQKVQYSFYTIMCMSVNIVIMVSSLVRRLTATAMKSGSACATIALVTMSLYLEDNQSQSAFDPHYASNFLT